MLFQDKKCLVCDLDGTLRGFSWEALYWTYVARIDYRGKSYKRFFRNLDEFKKWYNFDWQKNDKRIGCAKGIELQNEVENAIFHANYDPYIALFPWLSAIIPELAKIHELAVLTSSSEESARNTLGKFRRYFRVIAGCEHVAKLKPNPEGIKFVLALFKKRGYEFNPDDVVMIGDSEVDIKAGQNAGVKTGAVAWGMRNIKELAVLKPDHLFMKPRELLSAFGH